MLLKCGKRSETIFDAHFGQTKCLLTCNLLPIFHHTVRLCKCVFQITKFDGCCLVWKTVDACVSVVHLHIECSKYFVSKHCFKVEFSFFRSCLRFHSTLVAVFNSMCGAFVVWETREHLCCCGVSRMTSKDLLLCSMFFTLLENMNSAVVLVNSFLSIRTHSTSYTGTFLHQTKDMDPQCIYLRGNFF